MHACPFRNRSSEIEAENRLLLLDLSDGIAATYRTHIGFG